MNRQNQVSPTKKLHMSMVVFRETIHINQFRQFRGAMIEMSGSDPLFHNHQADGFHYRYPRIQYKLIDGHPGILGIEEGAVKISQMFGSKEDIFCRIGNKSQTLNIHSLSEWEEEAGLSDKMQNYVIEDWLPLNGDNYKEFQQTEGMIDRIDMLQRILVGNILSFATGMDIYFDKTVECIIKDIGINGLTRLKDVEMMSFSAYFSANVRLPQWIGLGKSASLSHGIIINLP